MKIYLVQHIIILKPVYKEHEPLIYKTDTYRSKKEDKQKIQKVVNHQKINNIKQYKVKWTGYNNTIQEPEENLGKAEKKGTKVLLLNKLGNIKKEELKIKELAKGD